MKAAVVFIFGLALLAAGLLFALQGAGIVAWPHESTMIGHREWIERGIVVILIGAALILTARRIRQ